MIRRMQIPPYETLATLASHVDPLAVVEHLQAMGSPADVASAYDTLLRDAYWKHKDLPLVLLLATAGMHFCLTHAKLQSDDALRTAFKSNAKALAYNLASFTWPGWAEPGITITPEQQARGMEAARINLRFALELNKPFDKVRAAAWLLGAHLLAVNQTEDALFQFQFAVPEKDAPDYELFHGYTLLAEVLMKDAEAETEWHQLLADLLAKNDEQSTFAREQLLTARRVFEKSADLPHAPASRKAT